METLRRLLGYVTRANERRSRSIAALRSSGFWCEGHWSMVEKMGIDPFRASLNIAYGLALIGAPTGTRAACCMFTEETLIGALDLMR